MRAFDFGLAGKKVVIVGSSTGIGLAVATEFARHGVNLVVTSHLDNVFDAKQQIEREAGHEVAAMKFDIAERDQVRAVIGEPHPDFLRDFKAQASSSTPAPKRKSKQAGKASRERACAPI